MYASVLVPIFQILLVRMVKNMEVTQSSNPNLANYCHVIMLGELFHLSVSLASHL